MTAEQISELRALRGQGMTSAVGEYTPDELWEALDEIEALREEIDLDNKRIAQLERVLKAVPACPDHGELCIPHAIGWIAKARQDQAAIAAKDAEIEALRKDAARLDWLETLLHRTEYRNPRRPAESVSSDMHFAHGNCNLYVRNLFGNAITGAGGSGESVRAAIDAAMKAQP
jgi:hypothetical protein